MTSPKLMLDESKTVYENILTHAGFDVGRNKDEGTLSLKPKTIFRSCIAKRDEDVWDFEPDLGNYTVSCLFSTKNSDSVAIDTSLSKEYNHEVIMSRSYHTSHSIEIPNASQASEWYAFESGETRIIVNEGDEVSIKVTINVNKGKKLYDLLEGTFIMPSKKDYDYVGTHGVFLLDPLGCEWSMFLDAMEVIYKDDPLPRTTLISVGLHAHLS